MLLWPDTFIDNFTPEVAVSAVVALEAAGFRVVLPARPVCCGLTWISTGQLGIARRVLRRTVAVLAPALRAGVPVVGLEPSCTAVFRADTAELLGEQDEDVAALRRQTRTLAELLGERAPDFAPDLGSGGRRAIPWEAVHGAGRDAIMILDGKGLSDRDELVTRSDLREQDVLGSTVLTDTGTALGEVTDVIVEISSVADVVGYEIRTGGGTSVPVPPVSRMDVVMSSPGDGVSASLGGPATQPPADQTRIDRGGCGVKRLRCGRR